jgi:2-oxoglutarate dehydrogenase E2 component (dihydrolipoamide succinyltransferase)
MTIDITIPSPGESITEVVLGPWHKAAGDWVERDETLVEIESDKVTLEVPASDAGVLAITAEEGAEMQVGDVIGSIDTDAARPSDAGAATDTAPARSDEASAVEVATATTAAAGEDTARATSLARKVAAAKGVPLTDLRGTGPSGRITKSDVLAAADRPAAASAAPAPAAIEPVPPAAVAAPAGPRSLRREKMSRLRQRVAERLVAAQRTTAMLTTFNEVDMSGVMELRSRHKESFLETHGVGLGFMSFFVKACTSALQAFPGINAYIDGDEVEFHDFVDVSVAVGTPKGLVVPVLRNAEAMSFADVEGTIKDLALRARDGKLTLEEMTGGTFTISNGGVYGSLMSTPILNPPQSGILGMHKIMKRAVEDPDEPGRLVLRPMMYLALSYDHRIVDGEQAVRFLIHVKERIEDPERMLLGV